MSYCRWSCNDFQCDLYCYEDCAGGFTTHVAKNRRIFKEPIPPDIEFTAENQDAWLERHNKIMAMCDDCDFMPIGLSCDGENLNDDTLEDFLATLLMLKAEGYRFPDYAIERVRSEIAEAHATTKGSDEN